MSAPADSNTKRVDAEALCDLVENRMVCARSETWLAKREIRALARERDEARVEVRRLREAGMEMLSRLEAVLFSEDWAIGEEEVEEWRAALAPAALDEASEDPQP